MCSATKPEGGPFETPGRVSRLFDFADRTNKNGVPRSSRILRRASTTVAGLRNFCFGPSTRRDLGNRVCSLPTAAVDKTRW